MINRYSREEMAKIWELQNRYQCMLDVEIAACKAMNKLKMIPDEDLKNITEKADFDIDRIDEIEKVTKHDVIAFLASVSEFVGPSSRFIHYGMTSSDVLDTATSMQLKQAGEMILRDMKRFAEVLKVRAKEHMVKSSRHLHLRSMRELVFNVSSVFYSILGQKISKFFRVAHNLG